MKIKLIKDRIELMNRYNKKGLSVLDVGCNDNEIHEILKSYNPSIYGCDIDDSLYKHIDKFDINKDWIYAKDCFDLIICGEIVEHLENPHKFLENCKMSLKFGGKLLITTPNCRTFSYNWNKLKKHDQHIYTWDLVLLERLVNKVGLKVKEKGYITSKRTYFFMRFFKSKSWHIYMICENNENKTNSFRGYTTIERCR